MKSKIVIAIALGLSALSLQAASTIGYEFGVLTTKSGGLPLADGSVVFIYVSTTGAVIDGVALQTEFTGQTLALGSVFGGSNIIIGATTVDSNSFGEAGTGNGSAPGIVYANGITAGDNIGLLWFQTSTPTIGGGVDFGFYTSANVMPNDPSVIDISISTDVLGGSVASSSLRSSFTTIPEPSAALLGALGALGLLRRRRI